MPYRTVVVAGFPLHAQRLLYLKSSLSLDHLICEPGKVFPCAEKHLAPPACLPASPSNLPRRREASTPPQQASPPAGRPGNAIFPTLPATGEEGRRRSLLS